MGTHHLAAANRLFFYSQSRSWLPDPIGGIFWYGVDDTYSNAYMPLYMGMTEPPKSLITGTIFEFDWNSAFWVFNLVSNYAYGLYSFIIEDIQVVQLEVENRAHSALRKAVDVPQPKHCMKPTKSHARIPHRFQCKQCRIHR
jgi:dipeptidase